MKRSTLGIAALAVISALLAWFPMGSAAAQGASDTPAAHVAAAKAAARQDHVALLNTLCTERTPAPSAAQSAPQQAPAAAPPPPARSFWHAEPVKVFDNLYFVGQTEFSSWAITTPEGIIILDAIWDYSVEDEVAGGLTKLGLDPKQIKYVVVSHGHIDHAGGAKFLQDHYGAHVLLSADDWDLLSRDKGPWPKPRRDMVVTDGQKLTLGGETLTFYITPGHTAGTISTLIPVTDHGTPHLVAEWGGTNFNWILGPGPYITPDRPSRWWFEHYRDSAARFRGIVATSGADALIANHTVYDGSHTKLPAALARKAGEPNPYVIGNDAVQRYLTVANECAEAGLLRLSSQ